MRRPASFHTKRVAICAMLAAISLVFLYMGHLVGVLELSAVGFASLFVLFCLREYGRTNAVMLYVATAFLALLLLPNKSIGLLYLLFGGLYPLLKFPAERHRRPLPGILKFLYLNLTVTLVEAASFFLLGLPFEGWWWLGLLYLVANPAFFLYDRLLDRLLILYEVRLRPRIRRFLS